MSTRERKETPCAEVSPSPTTSPTPTAALSSTPSPATAPTASTGTPARGGQSKLYLNSSKSAAYRCSPEGTIQFYLFSGRPKWLPSLYLVEQRPKYNPDKLPPAQWLDWWASVNLGWTEITQKEFDEMCTKNTMTANAAAALPDTTSALSGTSATNGPIASASLVDQTSHPATPPASPATVPTPAAAATTAAPAAAPTEILTTSESEADVSRCESSTSGSISAENSLGQSSPAETAPATQNPSGAAAACSAADGRHPQIVEHQPPLIQPETIYISPNGIRYKIAVVAVGKQQCFHAERFVNGKWSAANGSVYENLRDANGEFEAWIRTEKLKPEVAAAAIVPASNEAPTIADAGGEPMLPAFDYSTLPESTAQHLHNLAERALRLTRNYYLDLMEIVVEAHRELCGTVVHDVDNGHFAPKEDTFRAWCGSIGISKSRAYQLLQIQYIMDNSTPDEQENLAGLPYTTIREISKSNTPPEIVQAARQGDITTHKQYQDALARIKTLTEERDQARREKGELAADCNRLGRQAEKALSDKREAEQAAAAAEKERDSAQQTAQDAQARIRELEARPVEVVGASPENIAKWRAEGAASVQPSLQKAQTEKTAAENSAKEARRELERLKDAIDDYLSPQQASAQQAYMAANTIRGLFRSWCADALHWQLALEDVAAPLYHVATEISAAILAGHNIAPTDAGTEEDAEREAIFE